MTDRIKQLIIARILRWTAVPFLLISGCVMVYAAKGDTLLVEMAIGGVLVGAGAHFGAKLNERIARLESSI